MVNGQGPAPTNEHSNSHAHMPAYGGNANGAEPMIPGTAKAPTQGDVADASSTSVTSSSTSMSGVSAQTPNASKTWNFGSGNDSASNVNVPPSDSASSANMSKPAASGTQVDRSQTPTQSGAHGGQEGSKAALGASQATAGTEGDRAARPAEDEGGAAKGEGAGENAAPPEPEGGYPEQLHAGKLEGLGPEYADKTRVTMTDRITGLKERVKGTVKRDPDLKEQGKERMTGELKRKEREEEQSTDPFQDADEGKKSEDQQQDNDRMDEDDPPRPTNLKGDSNKTTTDTEAGTTEAPQVHPTDKGRQEQAASVRPEGEEVSQPEKRARSNVEAA